MTIYTGGTFDILHIGHINFLNHCKKLGDVTVALNTDEFIERYKGKKPLFSYEERKTHLLSIVSRVIPNDSEDSRPTILSVKPDVIAIGTDWAIKDYYKQMSFTQDWLDEQNITLIYIPYYKHISSSEIKRRCSQL
jgi:glycerol-3-phosphate cytidylyltransferase